MSVFVDLNTDLGRLQKDKLTLTRVPAVSFLFCYCLFGTLDIISMHFEELSHWSGNLGREMQLNRYGHSGIPVLVFASSGGSYTEYADFGMIEASREFIDAGKIQFFTLTSIDKESWLAEWKYMHDRALAHEAYERYVIEEAVPFIKHKTGWFDPMMVTGCSMGAYHALNFFLQHPDVFNKVIALSGIYDARFFNGQQDYGNDALVYQNSPADSIWNQNDGWFIDRYLQADIIVCTGLGAWEQDGLPSFYTLKRAFEEKQIPAWFDEWGSDVAHDWEWWRKQMPHFLRHIVS